MIDLESDVESDGSKSESQQTSQSGPGPETPPPAKQPSLVTAQCDDVANFVGARICSGEKYQLLTKHFKPGPEYIFPRCSSGRYFNIGGFSNIHGLSTANEKMVVSVCLVFSSHLVVIMALILVYL